MARIKTKDLKTQYMIRVYNQDEYEIFKRALEKFKDKFDSLNDAMKYFALPYSLNLWLDTSLFFISSLLSSTMERRVSSAAIISTSLSICLPRGDMSRELPMGVATM